MGDLPGDPIESVKPRRRLLRRSMTLLKCKKGHTLIDVAVVITLLATAVSTAGPLTRRVIARYQLNTAAHVLTADLVRARVSAIKANAVTSFYRTSDRYYRASGHPRQLPRMVRFTDASADSLAFNGLGALQDGVSRRFELYNTFGESVEIRVYAGGGHEVVKP
jgi:Tfp pilus assembly protein FimT